MERFAEVVIGLAITIAGALLAIGCYQVGAPLVVTASLGAATVAAATGTIAAIVNP